MAESQKKATSSAKPKEKSSELDLDFGNDFLSSWKDDGMDFDFGSASKGKKKTFDFGKADIDFNLDGAFGKLSSFNIDMSDLDISSPPRKAGKQTEQSKEVSPRESHRNKKDDFSFSFDFNKFDDLNFESTLTKVGEKSTKSKDFEGFSSQSESGASGAQLAKDTVPMEDDISSKLPATPEVDAHKSETEVGRAKDFDENEDDNLASVTNDSCPPVPANSGEQVAVQQETTSSVKTMPTIILENEQDNHKLENRSHQKSYHQEAVQDFSCQSLADSASTQGIASNIQDEDSVPSNLNSGPTGEQNVREELIAVPDSISGRSIDEPLASESTIISLLKNGEGTMSTGVDDVSINRDGEEQTRDWEFEHNSITTGSEKLLQGATANGINQDSTSKLHLAPVKSATTNGDLASEIKRGSNVIQSNYFKKPNEAESQLKASFSQTKLMSMESKRISTIQVITTDKRESDPKATQSGINLAGMSRLQPTVLRAELVHTGNAESVKSLNSAREYPDDSIESGNKLTGTSRIHDQEITNGLVLGRSEKKIENCCPPSSDHLHPTSSNEQANNSISKSCINPRLPALSIKSIKNTKSSFLEKNRFSPPKAVRRTLEHPSLKSSRTTGKAFEPLNPSVLKNIKPARDLEQRAESQGNIGSQTAHSAVTKKLTQPMPTLKRKAFEDSNAEPKFTPLKRFSSSPNESRNTRESLDRDADRQVCNLEDVSDDDAGNASKDCQTPSVDIPLILSLPELETTLSLENDSIVQKAEACSKELEDICNMLKKKHEEAKEILVRAIVNNNYLLMLNHPMHQEKINMVQKFAGMLISKFP